MEVIGALSNPKIYPHPVDKLQVLETHISWVFLTGLYAYKIKKPVNLDFLDFTTLEKRRYFCYKELELNRRLSPEIYLDVIEITKDNGKITLGGNGKVVEYALKMKEMKQSRMMDRLIEQDLVSEGMIEGIAKKIAAFHKEAKTGGNINTFGSIESIRFNTNENFIQTKEFIGKTITENGYNKILTFTNEFLEKNSKLFEERIANGRIRDCHGDLHSKNICFEDGIYIYDCIEFNERFRYGDVASEVAFLAMDLDFHYKFRLSDHFVRMYIDYTKDQGLYKLLNFYKCYRAYVRGKVQSFLAFSRDVEDKIKDKAIEEARAYFRLSSLYSRKRPFLYVLCGLIGVGKSHLAKELSKRLYVEVIDSDSLRKELAGIPKTEHRLERFGEGIYSEDFSRRTYKALFDKAKDLLESGRSIILDASFIRKKDRLMAFELAKECGADFKLLECRCPDPLIKERLILRANEEGVVSDGRLEIYESFKERFEEVREIPREYHLIIDTSKPYTPIYEALE